MNFSSWPWSVWCDAPSWIDLFSGYHKKGFQSNCFEMSSRPTGTQFPANIKNVHPFFLFILFPPTVHECSWNSFCNLFIFIYSLVLFPVPISSASQIRINKTNTKYVTVSRRENQLISTFHISNRQCCRLLISLDERKFVFFFLFPSSLSSFMFTLHGKFVSHTENKKVYISLV